jgi:hypothetical protein
VAREDCRGSSCSLKRPQAARLDLEPQSDTRDAFPLRKRVKLLFGLRANHRNVARSLISLRRHEFLLYLPSDGAVTFSRSPIGDSQPLPSPGDRQRLSLTSFPADFAPAGTFGSVAEEEILVVCSKPSDRSYSWYNSAHISVVLGLQLIERAFRRWRDP